MLASKGIMNKYFNFAFYLCLFAFIFKSTFPTFLDHGYVQWPAIALFGVLAPVAFAKTLHNYFSSTQKTNKLLVKPLIYFLLYLLIFAHANISFYGANSTYYNLANITNVYPSTLFNDLVEAEKEEERRAVAKLIYSEYGAKLPYPTETGEYTVYMPDTEALEMYSEKQQMVGQAKELRVFLKKAAYQSMYVGLYLIITFFFIFAVTIWLLQKKANKQLHRTP